MQAIPLDEELDDELDDEELDDELLDELDELVGPPLELDEELDDEVAVMQGEVIGEVEPSGG